MAWQIGNTGSKTRRIITTVAAVLRPSSITGEQLRRSLFSGIFNCFAGFAGNRPGSTTLAGFKDFGSEQPSVRRDHPLLRLAASVSSLGLPQQVSSYKVENTTRADSGQDAFDQMKERFLIFKKHKYLEEAKHYENLAQMQSPKFMVVACADSRVCPSNIIGFQPGEAFMIRNVANLVPPIENGPTETNAALEFAVNFLEVEHILVIGHSTCAGIQALMSMQDNKNSSFAEKWVANAKVAKLRTKADTSSLSFDQQCKHCEKESINQSLVNLLTYPWIEERVQKELLSIHGGYYDFLNCTFEKWTLDFKEIRNGEGGVFSIKDRDFWC